MLCLVYLHLQLLTVLAPWYMLIKCMWKLATCQDDNISSPSQFQWVMNGKMTFLTSHKWSQFQVMYIIKYWGNLSQMEPRECNGTNLVSGIGKTHFWIPAGWNFLFIFLPDLHISVNMLCNSYCFYVGRDCSCPLTEDKVSAHCINNYVRYCLRCSGLVSPCTSVTVGSW